MPEQSGETLLVSSRSLDAAVAQMRKTGVPSAILKCGVKATPEQLETAASILREAEPSRITHRGRARVEEPSQERPGYIDKHSQTDPDVLTFTVGILPMTEYRIAVDGSRL